MSMARTTKFISHPSDDQLERFPKEVRSLIKKGKEQGFVTHQELLKAMPNIEDDLILLDEIYSLFMDLGIEVIDTKDQALWDEKEWKRDVGKNDVDVLADEKKETLSLTARKDKKKKREAEFREIANDLIKLFKISLSCRHHFGIFSKLRDSHCCLYFNRF